MAFTIPFGKSKGTPLDQADAKDLQYCITSISKKLVDEPDGPYATKNRAWLDAAQAETARRTGQQSLGGSPAPRAARPAPAQNGGPKPSASALATRGPDALAGSFSDVNAAGDALRSAAAQMHLVSPATHCGMLPEGCGIAISVVHVDPNADKDGPGEVYKVGGKLGLSGTTLKKIGAAAAIDWDMGQSGRLDDGRDPHYCHYRAVGIVRNFDGSARTVSGEVEMDAREGSPQLDEIRTKAKDRPDGGDSQILELRKFLLRHAETKAKLRAIADMGVKRAYTPAELQKPFAVARLMWTGQTKDPELRRIFATKQMDAMVGSAAALYGRREGGPAALPHHAAHAPPPIGAVPADPDTFEMAPLGDDYDPAALGAADVPAATATSTTAPKPLEGLPADQDRGDDPDKY